MKEALRNIFYGLVVESLVGILSLLVGDQNTIVFLLIGGTILAGLLALFVAEQNAKVFMFFGVAVFAGWIFSGAPFSDGVDIKSSLEEVVYFFTEDTPKNSTQKSEYFLINLNEHPNLDYLQTNFFLFDLSPNESALSKIPFDFARTASTQCKSLSNASESFLLDVNIDNPLVIYIAIQAGNTAESHLGKYLGDIELIYSDNFVESFHLVLGENIRDWALDNPVAITSVSSSQLIGSYTGNNSAGTRGIIDILKLDISHKNSTLVGIHIFDKSQESFYDIDPCIYVPAITVQYVQ
ncbi:MAG: hypothetical protein ACT6FF_05685 [Methanosarcinaceae archaeon]